MEWQQVRQKTPGKTCGIMARHRGMQMESKSRTNNLYDNST